LQHRYQIQIKIITGARVRAREATRKVQTKKPRPTPTPKAAPRRVSRLRCAGHLEDKGYDRQTINRVVELSYTSTVHHPKQWAEKVVVKVAEEVDAMNRRVERNFYRPPPYGSEPPPTEPPMSPEKLDKVWAKWDRLKRELDPKRKDQS